MCSVKQDWDASPPCGLFLERGYAALSSLRRREHRLDGYGVIEISDTGVGMSEEVRALAQAQAQEIVRILEGEFDIVSQRRGGTTITITPAAG